MVWQHAKPLILTRKKTNMSHDTMLQALVLYTAEQLPEFSLVVEFENTTYRCTSEAIFLFEIDPQVGEENEEFFYYFLSHQAIMRFLAAFNLIDLNAENVMRLFEAIFDDEYDIEYYDMLLLQLDEYQKQLDNGLCITCHTFHDPVDFIVG